MALDAASTGLPVWLAEGLRRLRRAARRDAAALGDRRRPDHPAGTPRGCAAIAARATTSSTRARSTSGPPTRRPGSPAGCSPSGWGRTPRALLHRQADRVSDFDATFRRAFGLTSRGVHPQWRATLADLAAVTLVRAVRGRCRRGRRGRSAFVLARVVAGAVGPGPGGPVAPVRGDGRASAQRRSRGPRRTRGGRGRGAGAAWRFRWWWRAGWASRARARGWSHGSRAAGGSRSCSRSPRAS